MFYEVTIGREIYSTNIKTKKDALAVAKNQISKGNNVVVFRKYPETDRQPSHTEIIYYYINGIGELHGREI
jgi:hypothetical protein